MNYVVTDRAAWRGSVGPYSAMNLVNKAKKRANKKCATATDYQGTVPAVWPRGGKTALLCVLVKRS